MLIALFVASLGFDVYFCVRLFRGSRNSEIRQRTADVLPFTRNEHRPRRCARLRSNR